MKRKLCSNEKKVAIVLKMVGGNEMVAEICTRHGMSTTQAYRCLDRFLEGGCSAPTDKRTWGGDEASNGNGVDKIVRKGYNTKK